MQFWKGNMMKKLLLLIALASSVLLANSTGEKAKDQAKDKTKSAVE